MGPKGAHAHAIGDGERLAVTQFRERGAGVYAGGHEPNHPGDTLRPKSFAGAAKQTSL
jgi:hypothetical protein